MGNRYDVAEKLKTKMRDSIREKGKVTFGDLKREFCDKIQEKSGKRLMSKRTFAKYLSELVDSEWISKRHDRNSQKVYYYENPIAKIIERIDKLHRDYLKSIKTLEEAKRYCEILWLANNRASKRKPKSEIIKVDF